jgi:hypothetical protein
MEMGILAMQKLHRLIKGDPEIAVKSVVYGELIVRESSEAASPPAGVTAGDAEVQTVAG